MLNVKRNDMMTCKDCIWYTREKPLQPEQYYCMELLKKRKKIVHIPADHPICEVFEHWDYPKKIEL